MAEEMVKSSKADPSSKMTDANPPPKDGVLSDATSCISSVDACGSIKESELDREPLVSEQTMYYPPGSYYGYYYPGFDGSTYVDWGSPNYVVQTNGMETQHSVVPLDGAQTMYYAPGFQTGYNTYGAFVPGAMVGVDGQYVYQQPYVLSPVIPQSQDSPAYITSPVGYGPELVPTYPWDSFWDGYSYTCDPGLTIPSQKGKSFSKMQPLKNNNSTAKPNIATEQAEVNQPLKSSNKSTNFSKGYYPTTKAPSFSPQGAPGILYRANPGNAKEAGRTWFDTEKLRARSKSNLVGNSEMLSEQNRGPRTDNLKTTWTSVTTQTNALTGVADDRTSSKMVIIKRDDYNLPDFQTKYDDALFFVIKSYSEDDIHKSIKYNVWASTPNGNRRLDSAYEDAQQKKSGGSNCPIFLFFSVNASGQFCGVAEMVGRVDFNKNMDFWQQDKWNGYFPVKWHIIKDVPNPQFRHIILENNDNKPVTNSRDTQEVKFPQGIEMLNIFKGFSSRTSILDDFVFYENRQKVMLEKRSRFSVPSAEQFLPKVDSAAIKKSEELMPITTSFGALDLTSNADASMEASETQVAVAAVQ